MLRVHPDLAALPFRVVPGEASWYSGLPEGVEVVTVYDRSDSIVGKASPS